MAADRDLPWFSFYVRDWMDSDTVGAMSDAAVVCYLQLLCRQWVNGSIPANPRKLAAILRRPVEEFVADVWPQVSPCFVPTADDPDHLENPRLARERLEAESKTSEKREWATAAGNASAESRRRRQPTPVQRPFNARSNERSTPVQRPLNNMDNGHGHEDLPVAPLSLPGDRPAEPSAGPGNRAHPERERERALPTKEVLPSGNAPKFPGAAAGPPKALGDAVWQAWAAAYRAATGSTPLEPGPMDLHSAVKIAATGIEAEALRRRMDRFLAGAPAEFWRRLPSGEWPNFGGFVHCFDRLAEAAPPVVAAPPAVSAARASPNAASRDTGSEIRADALRGLLEIQRRQREHAEDAARTIDAEVVEPRSGAPPPSPPLLALVAAGGEP